ncbi:hypothetical protein ACFPIK_08880 [Algoriphagus aquatilis]|uniref:Uncharacterized protein n=1 Tax=Algoriphagus aquatilis TaxID=490186 RepID=A0ABW0BWZ8_9BACT
MALIRGKMVFEVTFEDLPVPLSHYTSRIIQRICAEQIFYTRPWADKEDIKHRRPNIQIKVIQPNSIKK